MSFHLRCGRHHSHTWDRDLSNFPVVRSCGLTQANYTWPCKHKVFPSTSLYVIIWRRRQYVEKMNNINVVYWFFVVDFTHFASRRKIIIDHHVTGGTRNHIRVSKICNPRRSLPSRGLQILDTRMWFGVPPTRWRYILLIFQCLSYLFRENRFNYIVHIDCQMLNVKNTCVCETLCSWWQWSSEKVIFSTKVKFKGHKVIDLGVIWKGIINFSWVTMHACQIWTNPKYEVSICHVSNRQTNKNTNSPNNKQTELNYMYAPDHLIQRNKNYTEVPFSPM